jgi:hypothetical protein
VIEGTAGLAVAFLLLALIVQVAGAATARHAAEAAVSAGARRAARPGADPGVEERRLAADLATALPGAGDLQVEVSLQAEEAVAAARFRWLPPGPDWVPITIAVRAAFPRVVPP